jgi:hypothetical protein
MAAHRIAAARCVNPLFFHTGNAIMSPPESETPRAIVAQRRPAKNLDLFPVQRRRVKFTNLHKKS